VLAPKSPDAGRTGIQLLLLIILFNMLKAIRAATRTVKDTVGISQGEDAEAKKNLIEIKDAASTLHKTVSATCVSPQC
jgi:hypothetical protein